MRPIAELLTVGAELLKGSTLNTNAQFLGRELTRVGFKVGRQTACCDDKQEIESALKEAMTRAKLVIVTGGLGPTPDDLTRQAMAAYLRSPLQLCQNQFRHLKTHYAKRKRSVPKIVRIEAMFPKAAVPLVNRHGVALGFYFFCQKQLVVVLPGVPSEMKKMYRELVSPLIQRQFRELKKSYAVTAKTVGVSEPAIIKGLGKGFFKWKHDFGIYPNAGEVALRIQASEAACAKRIRKHIERKLGKHIYAYEEKSLPEVIGALLRKKRKTLAVAESCTGGKLASEITLVSGASRYFKGSVTAYHNDVKSRYLGVSPKKIKDKGAVSGEVALELACGAREKLKSTYGIGITGVAGPRGGSAAKPVGTVYIAIATPSRVRVYKHVFWGDRAQVQSRAVKKALEYLWRELK